MILHAVSIAAFFVDQMAQAPVQIQCVMPPNADPVWKQWIPTAVSLISIGIGVWIARWSFRASSRRDHEQWVRDQKRIEWKELISHIAVIEKEVPIILSGMQKYEKLEPAVLAIVAMLDNTLFIWTKIQDSGFVGQWISFVAFVSNQFLPAVRQNNHATNEMLAGRLDIDTQNRIEQDWLKNEKEIRQKLSGLLNNLRTIAHDDMGIQTIA
jgi:hypothetical protein